MANHADFKPGGWAFGEEFLSSQMNAAKAAILKTPNMAEGSTHTPSGPVIVQGSGLHLANYATADASSVSVKTVADEEGLIITGSLSATQTFTVTLNDQPAGVKRWVAVRAANRTGILQLNNQAASGKHTKTFIDANTQGDYFVCMGSLGSGDWEVLWESTHDQLSDRNENTVNAATLNSNPSDTDTEVAYAARSTRVFGTYTDNDQNLQFTSVTGLQGARHTIWIEAMTAGAQLKIKNSAGTEILDLLVNETVEHIFIDFLVQSNSILKVIGHYFGVPDEYLQTMTKAQAANGADIQLEKRHRICLVTGTPTGTEDIYMPQIDDLKLGHTVRIEIPSNNGSTISLLAHSSDSSANDQTYSPGTAAFYGEAYLGSDGSARRWYFRGWAGLA